MKKVIVAGHICLDITPKFPARKETDIGALLLPGKLLHMENAEVHTGGAVANTGLAMKIMGADVSLMGKIGTDAFGDMVCSILRKYGAAEGMIRLDSETTSYTVVLAVPGIDRIFLHHPGANHTFCAADVAEEALQGADLFHFGYPPIMRRMYEEGGAELEALFRKAKAAGCATSLDLAAVDEESDAGAADWNHILQRTLPFVDFFVPSAEELCYMLDYERFTQWQRAAAGRDITEILDIDRDVRPLAKQCMTYGARVVVIKCGARGMYYRTADEGALSGISRRAGLDTKEWRGREGFEHRYLPDCVRSATGAGDTSIAAFLTAMLNGKSVERCMQLSTAAGAACVACYDALSGISSLDELEKKIDAGWKKS